MTLPDQSSPTLRELEHNTANSICVTKHGVYFVLSRTDTTVVWLDSTGRVINRIYYATRFTKMTLPAFNKPVKFHDIKSDFTNETFKL